MNYAQNPCAPPQAAPPPVEGSSAAGSPQPWTPGEVVALAWDRFKTNWAVLIFSWLVMFVIVEVFASVPSVLELAHMMDASTPAFVGVSLMSHLVQLAVTVFFQVGIIRIWLEAARGGAPSFALLFSGFDRLLPLLGCSILQGIAIGVGLLVFIVPGVLLFLGLCVAQFYVVDARMGPISALAESWKATHGQRGNLFVLGLALIGLGIMGLMMCGVGLFVTMEVGYVAWAIAFVRMSGRGATQSHAPPGPMPAVYY